MKNLSEALPVPPSLASSQRRLSEELWSSACLSINGVKAGLMVVRKLVTLRVCWIIGAVRVNET